MKYCNSCEQEKDISMFGNRKASKDGLSSKCKSCQKVYDKARSGDNHRKMQRAIYAQTEEGKIAGNKAKALYRKRNPKKYKAHTLVNNAIRDGRMKKEKFCSVCNSEVSIHAHHDDYNYPLSIRWLCAVCHSKWHRDNEEGINAK